jgi:LmbE family N-acetylglucosaminyl deacetylase
MANDMLRILIIGAHPDDPEWYAGGVAYMYAQQGHRVKMVSLTNGDAGHPTIYGAPLAKRRREEAAAAGAVLGVEGYVVLDNHDAALLPTLEVREQVVRIMREFKPDLVMTHRPWDYHADHRYTAQVVQDATIPAGHARSVLPDLPLLQPMPRMVFMWDEFTRPYAFIPDVVVGIDDAIEKKVDALHCHTSQMYEGMAYFAHAELLEDPAGRRAWLWQHIDPNLRAITDLYRDRLVALYGEEKGKQIKYAEAFEVCEYGKPALQLATLLSDAQRARLFPFFGDT